MYYFLSLPFEQRPYQGKIQTQENGKKKLWDIFKYNNAAATEIGYYQNNPPVVCRNFIAAIMTNHIKSINILC